MAATLSTRSMTYTPGERMHLLQAALESIESGLKTGSPKAVNHPECPVALRKQHACFVTLTTNGVLRGCIGSLEAHRGLIDDAAANAFAAAYRDPRFHKLENDELDLLHIGISVLGRSEMLTFDSQQSLLDRLCPGKDGLILREGNSRGTFLPTVWKSIPAPENFLNQLKIKAGLAEDYWSDTLEVWRYHCESFSAPVSAIRKAQADLIIAE